MIKPRIMNCAGHVAGMGERKWAYRVLVGSLRGRVHLEEKGMDWRIILKLNFKK
jgi:hypothetical protein